MPKRKKQRKPRRRVARPDKPMQPPSATAVQRAARQALAAGILRDGLQDPDETWRAYSQAMSYEVWLQAGRPIEEANFDDWPPAYLSFVERWPDAFEFYRHNLFAYLSWPMRLSPWGEMLNSLVQRVRAIDPQGYERLRGSLDKADERFYRQRDASQQVVLTAAQAEGPDLRLVAALNVYTTMYEIDLPLWFLGVIGKAIKESRFRPEYLGGPETLTSQGSLVDTVSSDLEGTPLHEPFHLAYDAALRNAVAHNDWEVRSRDNGSYEVVDHRTGTTWSNDEAWDRILAAQVMHHAVILAVQLTVSGHLVQPQGFADIGVLSFTSFPHADGSPAQQ